MRLERGGFHKRKTRTHTVLIIRRAIVDTDASWAGSPHAGRSAAQSVLCVRLAAGGAGPGGVARGPVACSTRYSLHLANDKLCVRGAHAHAKPDWKFARGATHTHSMSIGVCTHRAGAPGRPLIPEFQCRAEAGAQGLRARERESADGIRTDAWGAPRSG